MPAAGGKPLVGQAHEPPGAGLPGDPDLAPAERRLQPGAAALFQQAAVDVEREPEVVAAHHHLPVAADGDRQDGAARAQLVAGPQARRRLDPQASALGGAVIDLAAAEGDEGRNGQQGRIVRLPARRPGRGRLDQPLAGRPRVAEQLIGRDGLVERLGAAAGPVGMDGLGRHPEGAAKLGRRGQGADAEQLARPSRRHGVSHPAHRRSSRANAVNVALSA